MNGYRSLEDALAYGTEVERAYVCAQHDDHSPSASVNAVTGLFCCYACGHAGKVDTAKLTFDAEGVASFTAKVYEAMTPANGFVESWLNIFDVTGPGEYWLSRFDEATCAYFRLGSAPGVATYPMRDEAGAVLGIVTRDLTGKREAKYLYPHGVTVSDHLIEAWRCEAETILLVEGMADVAAVREAGHWALGCYKAGLSARQAALLARYGAARVFCAFDMDDAGEKGWRAVQRLLRPSWNLYRLEWDSYGDIAEIPLEERRAMLDETVGQSDLNRVVTIG